MGVCFHKGPAFGEHDRRFFLRTFLFRVIFMRFSRNTQMSSKRVSLSIWVMLGKLEVVCLPGFLREKYKVYLSPFLGPRGH